MSASPGPTPDPALGFDVGSRWIGVAIGNALSGASRALCTLDREQGRLWDDIDRLLAEWRPGILVVGDPLALDGSEQEATHIARRFARQLGQRSGLPVVRVDERHSSQEAARAFASARRSGQARRRDAARLDAVAAATILQRWYDTGMPLSSGSSHD